MGVGRKRTYSEDSPYLKKSRIVENRPPMQAPDPNHKQYNRFKYFDKLKNHSMRSSDADPQDWDAMSDGYIRGDLTHTLEIPKHIIDDTLFYFNLPFMKPVTGKQSSTIIIFSVWKTMLGSAVVSLPWAF